ncbi:hypothetical protein LTR86_011224 [Recurvomyces mirabilis]|nr:hypothetical protein LTR86_011224 [Recurvomyces mirabilis]
MVSDISIVGGGSSGLAFAAICEVQVLSYVLYERDDRYTPPRGGSLDLHPDSGQLAMKEAGVFQEFLKHARGGEYTISWVYDHRGNKVCSWGEGLETPEIDREEIKTTLLTDIPDEKICWNKALLSATRDDKGRILLESADGSNATGFKLVVGADGSSSKIRKPVTPAIPKYWGVKYFTSSLLKSDPFFPNLYKQADDFRVDFGFKRPFEIGRGGFLDEQDTQAVKEALPSDDFFGHHWQLIKDMISAVDGPFHDWPLWEMPVEGLSWEPSHDVTWLGDAAHTTTPFIAEGASCAMHDPVTLARKLEEFGLGQKIIAVYEEEMFGYAGPIVNASATSGNLFFESEALKGLFEAMMAKYAEPKS